MFLQTARYFDFRNESIYQFLVYSHYSKSKALFPLRKKIVKFFVLSCMIMLTILRIIHFLTY